MSIPFIDLKAQYARIEQTIQDNIKKVLDHGQYVMGAEIKELEEKLAEYCGTKYAVACASGTDALTMSLLALGIGRGDAVFTSAFTFFATGETIAMIGATPIFVDVDPRTMNMDCEKLQEAIDKVKAEGKLKATAIMPVDIFGMPCDYDAMMPIAEAEGLKVIEDAAQAFGADFKGKRCCSYGEIGCTSFFPAKPLGCYGDGGMCFTDDEKLYELLLSVRVHGQGKDKYENVRFGVTGRMDTMQAAILLPKFDLFPEELEKRNEIAAYYNERLGVSEEMAVPFIPEGLKSCWAQYTLIAKDEATQEKLVKALQDASIPVARYYPLPLHMQKAFDYLEYKPEDLPVTYELSKTVFSLPMHPYLTKEMQDTICDTLLNA
ncbi:MAG: DegT/DnrJ/EryC1/StrS family aminotransferase [Desulfovibrio sp.]